MSEYTPEPWRLEPNGAAYNLVAAGADRHHAILVGMTHLPPGRHAANARRIVTTVNACAGLPTDALQEGWLAVLAAACEEALLAYDAAPLALHGALEKVRTALLQLRMAQVRGRATSDPGASRPASP